LIPAWRRSPSKSTVSLRMSRSGWDVERVELDRARTSA
jgi:hypothetical protein